MKFPIRMNGRAQCMLILILLFPLTCVARDIQPVFLFRNTFDVAGAPFVRTESEAQAAVRIGFTSMYPNFTVTDFYADTSSPLRNGHYDQYEMHFLANGDTYWTGAYSSEMECPKGWKFIANQVISDYIVNYICTPDPVAPPVSDCFCNASKVGDPIIPSTGIEEEMEVDYDGAGGNGLSFSRTYRSDHRGWAHNYQIFGIDFSIASSIKNWPETACYFATGSGSGFTSCFPYASSGTVNDFMLQRGNGPLIDFGTATDFSPNANINDRVTKLLDSAGNATGYSIYNGLDDSTELFGTNGRLLSIASRNGKIVKLSYSDTTTPSNVAPRADLLLSVTDNFGRHLVFTYDSQARMATMTDPSGGIYTYGYDGPSSVVVEGAQAPGNLTSVTYPDGGERVYWYNEQDKTAGTNQPLSLTGITDEKGTRYATITYDSSGRAISTVRPGGVEQFNVDYPSQYTTSTVTDPLGAIRTYSFKTILGVVKGTGVTQPAGAGSAATATSISYDANGNIANYTDVNGVVTHYNYDLTRNLESSRVEAYGTPSARTITTTWHSAYRLPLKVAAPTLLTTFDYDASGNLLTKTVQATSDTNGAQGLSAPVIGTPRKWTYTYDAVGQLLTATGPRTEISDITHYAYDTMGNLSTVMNAAGEVTTLSNYDANGRVGRIAAPNGVTTDLTYTPRGWLSSRVVTSGSVVETTAYAYDGVGQLVKVTLPDISSIDYTYDDAHRLTALSDSLGNSITYTLDNAGNRLGQSVADPTGTLARQSASVYDALSRLQQQTGAAQ